MFIVNFFFIMNDSEATIRREAYIHVKLDKCNKTKSKLKSYIYIDNFDLISCSSLAVHANGNIVVTGQMTSKTNPQNQVKWWIKRHGYDFGQYFFCFFLF